MADCGCGGCTCGAKGIQIENLNTDIPNEEIEFEHKNINNLWKTPTIYPFTDGNTNG